MCETFKRRILEKMKENKTIKQKCNENQGKARINILAFFFDKIYGMRKSQEAGVRV